MTCPICQSEVAYTPLVHGFLCMAPECGWELELSEDEVFALFFRPAATIMRAGGRRIRAVCTDGADLPVIRLLSPEPLGDLLRDMQRDLAATADTPTNNIGGVHSHGTIDRHPPATHLRSQSIRIE